MVQRGINDHTVLALLEHFRGTGVTVRLIEYMDVGSRNEWRREQVVPSRELLQMVSARWPLGPLERGAPADVAERHGFADGRGEIGFISSVITALLRRLLARAAVFRRRPLHLPVRDPGAGFARTAAQRRFR